MMSHFTDMTGGLEPTQYIDKLENEPIDVAKNRILANKELFRMLQETKSNGGRPVVISDKEDEMVSHTRGYGDNERPEDYLDAFSGICKNKYE